MTPLLPLAQLKAVADALARAGKPAWDAFNAAGRQATENRALAGMLQGADPGTPLEEYGKELAEGDPRNIGTNVAGALLGSLRAGGMADIIATHSSDLYKFLGKGNAPLKELYSPSFAVSKGHIPTLFQQDPEHIILVPRAGALDPALAHSSLFNRDAYTPRWRDYDGQSVDQLVLGMDKPALKEMARLRLGDKFDFPDPRIGQYKADPVEAQQWLDMVEPSQAAAIIESPAFRSFGQYEASRAGAKTLLSNENLQPMNSYMQRFENAFNPIAKKVSEAAGIPEYSGQAWIEAKAMRNQGMLTPDEANTMNYLQKMAREAPSYYGELKVSGPLQITPDTFAGMIVQGLPGEEQIAALQKAYPKLPMEWAIGLRNSPEEMFDLASDIQLRVPPVGLKPLWPTR